MANNTKKRIVDDILILLTRFGITDDTRFDPLWISTKIDQCRSQLIIASYQNDGVVDRTWLSDLSVQSLHSVNYPDDINISSCCCEVSKLFIPNVVSLRSRSDGNIDLGLFSVMGVCGKKEYSQFPMNAWQSIPKEHVRSRFNYYDRINTSLYVNKAVEKLLIRAVLEHPEDGFIINSEPVTVIATGTTYLVKGAQVTYNGVVYSNNDTFVGAIGVTAFTGAGKVYLNSQIQALIDTEDYPCSADMIRQIIIDICVKEFGIEASQITDTNNNSVDDQQKAKVLQ